MSSDNLTLPGNDRYHELELRILIDDAAAGSFCRISKAEVIETGEVVALKRSRTPLSNDVSEALFGAAYVPRTLYREERTPCLIVEEWIDGTTLFELAGNNGIRDSCFDNIAKRLLTALCDMHYERRVYHGDLTPSNVLWRVKGTGCEIFITDFDPWYPIDENGRVNAPDISGSMPFLPPEYIFGNLKFNGEKAMTYCAGAVLYYTRYGRPPYCERFDRDTIRRLMFGPQAADMIEVDRIQRADFRSWKKHLESHDRGALWDSSDSYGNAFKMMLSFDPQSRPDLKSAVSLFVDSDVN